MYFKTDDGVIINAELYNINDNIVIENKNSIMSIEFINNDTIIERSAVIDLGFLDNEEFLEKFPYKVGDFVRVPDYESEVRIDDMKWDGVEIQYEIFTDETEWYSAKELNEWNEPMKGKKSLLSQLIEYFETTPKEILEKEWKENEYLDKIGPYVEDYMVFYESVMKKKQPKYPKTYEECYEALGDTNTLKGEVIGYKSNILTAFQRLLICRDAYWKIAGEQMGLDKPWKPDWENENEFVYCLWTDKNKITEHISFEKKENRILAFPTEEMRDTFYENFKELIESCKELL